MPLSRFFSFGYDPAFSLATGVEYTPFDFAWHRSLQPLREASTRRVSITTRSYQGLFTGRQEPLPRHAQPPSLQPEILRTGYVYAFRAVGDGPPSLLQDQAWHVDLGGAAQIPLDSAVEDGSGNPTHRSYQPAVRLPIHVEGRPELVYWYWFIATRHRATSQVLRHMLEGAWASYIVAEQSLGVPARYDDGRRAESRLRIDFDSQAIELRDGGRKDGRSRPGAYSSSTTPELGRGHVLAVAAPWEIARARQRLYSYALHVSRYLASGTREQAWVANTLEGWASNDRGVRDELQSGAIPDYLRRLKTLQSDRSALAELMCKQVFDWGQSGYMSFLDQMYRLREQSFADVEAQAEYCELVGNHFEDFSETHFGRREMARIVAEQRAVFEPLPTANNGMTHGLEMLLHARVQSSSHRWHPSWRSAIGAARKVADGAMKVLTGAFMSARNLSLLDGMDDVAGLDEAVARQVASRANWWCRYFGVIGGITPRVRAQYAGEEVFRAVRHESRYTSYYIGWDRGEEERTRVVEYWTVEPQSAVADSAIRAQLRRASRVSQAFKIFAIALDVAKFAEELSRALDTTHRSRQRQAGLIATTAAVSTTGRAIELSSSRLGSMTDLVSESELAGFGKVLGIMSSLLSISCDLRAATEAADRGDEMAQTGRMVAVAGGLLSLGSTALAMSAGSCWAGPVGFLAAAVGVLGWVLYDAFQDTPFETCAGFSRFGSDREGYESAPHWAMGRLHDLTRNADRTRRAMLNLMFQFAIRSRSPEDRNEYHGQMVSSWLEGGGISTGVSGRLRRLPDLSIEYGPFQLDSYFIVRFTSYFGLREPPNDVRICVRPAFEPSARAPRRRAVRQIRRVNRAGDFVGSEIWVELLSGGNPNDYTPLFAHALPDTRRGTLGINILPVLPIGLLAERMPVRIEVSVQFRVDQSIPIPACRCGRGVGLVLFPHGAGHGTVSSLGDDLVSGTVPAGGRRRESGGLRWREDLYVVDPEHG